jgi:hypothetical protein
LGVNLSQYVANVLSGTGAYQDIDSGGVATAWIAADFPAERAALEAIADRALPAGRAE